MKIFNGTGGIEAAIISIANSSGTLFNITNKTAEAVGLLNRDSSFVPIIAIILASMFCYFTASRYGDYCCRGLAQRFARRL